MKNTGCPLILLALLASACSAAPIIPGGSSLAGSSWHLVSLGSQQAPRPPVPGSRITLEFEDAGRVGGFGGCNSYGGKFRSTGSELRFSELLSTLMACADAAVTQQEQDYFAALGSATDYSIDGDKLTIVYSGGALIFLRATPG